MRIIKTFGLAVVAAVAIAFPSSVAASNTQVCKNHEEPCSAGNAVSSATLKLKSGEIWLLHSLSSDQSEINILCLSVPLEIEFGALAAPQSVTINSLSYENCGTEGSGGSHSNCEVKVLHLPWSADLLKTALNLGGFEILSGTGGEPNTFMKCTVFGFIKVECEYSNASYWAHLDGATGTSSSLLLLEGVVPLVSGGSLCKEESEITLGTFSGSSTETVETTTLCKAHEIPCTKKATNLDMVAVNAPVLLNSIANVECEKSLAAATILGGEGANTLDLTELTWTECHTQGAADNCTVTNTTLPTLSVKGTALNLGSVTQVSGAVRVKCNILGLHELDCTYGGSVALSFEGALHSSGTGHGMLTASKATVKRTEAKEGCPETAKWDLLYEPAEHVYLVIEKATKEGKIYVVS